MCVCVCVCVCVCIMYVFWQLMRRGEGIVIGAGHNNAIRIHCDFLHGSSGYIQALNPLQTLQTLQSLPAHRDPPIIRTCLPSSLPLDSPTL